MLRTVSLLICPNEARLFHDEMVDVYMEFPCCFEGVLESGKVPESFVVFMVKQISNDKALSASYIKTKI